MLTNHCLFCRGTLFIPSPMGAGHASTEYRRWYSCYSLIDGECMATLLALINTLRPRQNGCHFPDDIFKCIFLNENVLFAIKISLTFVPRDLINNIPALVQIMAWRRPGDKPLSQPVMARLLTHICVTRPQWVNWPFANGKIYRSMSPSSPKYV